MIEIKSLHKSYKTGSTSLHVLKGIDFSVKEGEMDSIVGFSGSGKYTLLNILDILDEAEDVLALKEGVFVEIKNGIAKEDKVKIWNSIVFPFANR